MPTAAPRSRHGYPQLQLRLPLLLALLLLWCCLDAAQAFLLPPPQQLSSVRYQRSTRGCFPVCLTPRLIIAQLLWTSSLPPLSSRCPLLPLAATQQPKGGGRKGKPPSRAAASPRASTTTRSSGLVAAFSSKEGETHEDMTVSIHWFRKGLRLHDNPALLEACRCRVITHHACPCPHARWSSQARFLATTTCSRHNTFIT